MIEVIAIDYGGVLGTEADAWDTTFKEVMSTSQLTLDEMNRIWEKHWPKLKIGVGTIMDYWNDAAKKSAQDPEKLREIYNNSITIDQEMFKLVKSLKIKNRLIILSNDTTDWMNAKKKRFDLEDIFEKIYSSGDIGLAKPDSKIFEYVLNDLNIKPEELLFVDNQQNNIDAARKIGIKTLLFTDIKSLISSLP
jgi:putative hydrolase of the HAD superfamily